MIIEVFVLLSAVAFLSLGLSVFVEKQRLFFSLIAMMLFFYLSFSSGNIAAWVIT